MISGSLIIANGIYNVFTSSFFAVSFDFTYFLIHFFPGIMILGTGFLLLRISTHNIVIGLIAVFSALFSLLSGGGFLIGLIAGLIGAILILTWKSNIFFIRSIKVKLMGMNNRKRKIIFIISIVLLFLIVVPTELSYQMYMNSIRENLLTESKIIETAFGPVEYSEVGEGIPVLVVHGAGFGYIQTSTVDPLFDDGFRLIAPSRPGFLRTPISGDASFAVQADVLASLLDELNVTKVVVVAVSVGGPTALQFALRHPDRISELIMISSVSHTAPPMDLFENLILHNMIFRSDFAFWLITKNFQSELTSFLGVSSEVQATLTTKEKEYTSNLINAMHPISTRIDGVLNDRVRETYELENFPIEQVLAPTLVFHAKDDTLVPFSHGQYSSQHIPDAKFVPLDNGGHFLIGQHEIIKTEIAEFLK